MSFPTLFFFFKAVLATLGPLQFCMRLKIHFPFLQKKKKKAVEILTGISLNL